MISKNLKITGLNIEGWGRGKGEKTTLFVRREDNRNQGGGEEGRVFYTLKISGEERKSV